MEDAEKKRQTIKISVIIFTIVRALIIVFAGVLAYWDYITGEITINANGHSVEIKDVSFTSEAGNSHSVKTKTEDNILRISNFGAANYGLHKYTIDMKIDDKDIVLTYGYFKTNNHVHSEFIVDINIDFDENNNMIITSDRNKSVYTIENNGASSDEEIYFQLGP